jgi:ATP-binding cassette subfamily F protein 3
MKYAKNNWRHKKSSQKKRGDRKINRKFRAKASKASMAQSMIKKLDKIDRIEVDEDDNSVMNISFPLSKFPEK